MFALRTALKSAGELVNTVSLKGFVVIKGVEGRVYVEGLGDVFTIENFTRYK